MLKQLIGITLLFLILLLNQCANPIAPTGGIRDEIPPQLVTELSTPNYQTNFEKQLITLTFDEWINLKDVFNQVIISPPLIKRPEISIKKKSVLIEFDKEEVLREEATYTINFGEAVQDLTEGNPAENLRFIFSTGDLIDSLSVSGTIVDAITSEPVEGAIFALYENLADTVVRTERPFYFAKTDKNGAFRVENVKADTFKVFAIKDANLNYLFDQKSESIGFLDSFIILPASEEPFLELRLFKEDPVLQLSEIKNETFGRLSLGFNKEVPQLDISSNNPDFEWTEFYEKDTLKLWYSQEIDSSTLIFVRFDTLLYDTITLASQSKAYFVDNNQLKYDMARKANIIINPDRTLQLSFNHPIAEFDPTKVRLFADTSENLVEPTLRIDTLSNRLVNVLYPWRENIPYRLEFYPGAFTDIYDLSTQDTLIQDYRGGARKDFGALSLNFIDLDTNAQYVVHLYKSGGGIVNEYILANTEAKRIIIKSLPPGKYEVHIITDLNKNGKWDTGNYDLMLQPEPYFKQAPDQLRANWEVERDFSILNLQPISSSDSQSEN